MIEELLKELQEIESLQSQIEARLKKMVQNIKRNKASKQERNRYKSLKGSLESTVQRARSVKTSISQIRVNVNMRAKRELKSLIKAGQIAKQLTPEAFKLSGPFDALPAPHPYLKGARAAANRIELKHPGFFAKYGSLPNILNIIWDYYASYHRDNYYDTFGDLYVDDNLYENLLKVLSYEEEKQEREG